MIYNITLTKPLYELAKQIGLGRRNENTLRRTANNDTSPRVSLKDDQIGALGEIIVLTHLNLPISYNQMVIPWQQFGKVKHQIHDVLSYEIKTIEKPNYNLICNCKGLTDSKLNSPHILVYIDLINKIGQIIGYAYGYEIKNLNDIRTHPGPPFYFYSKSKLHNIKELF